jgi:hypothetical protein
MKKRKPTVVRIVKSTMSLLAFTTIVSVLTPGVSAATIHGKVTFIGTMPEDSSDGNYNARVRVRVNGTCELDSPSTDPARDYWVEIKSGRMDGIYAHNSVNMKNAYSTLVSSLLSGKSVQIDGLPNCNPDSTVLELWRGQVGLF